MGQSNESENPSLILENLQNASIEGENDLSLEKSFNIIRNILTDYKFFKDIISKIKKLENKSKSKIFKKSKINILKEYSKEELMNIKEINYDKNIINDVEHKISRIKKWVKMSKSSLDNKNIIDDYEIIFDDNNNNKIKNKNKNKNKNINNSEKFNLSNYTDLKIESGILNFCQKDSSKFINRVKKGPPDSFRWCSWCILNFLPQDRTNLIYENYTNMILEKENKDRIIRDIERTFSKQKIEKKELRKMETSLYRILKAFWNLDKEIGYCQGMNLIVGFMLIISKFKESDTFYLLTSIFSNTFKSRKKYEYNLRGLFYDEFPLLNLLNYIFEKLLEQHCPEIMRHLENLGITIDLWMGRWFHTLFILILPINWCKRLWDNMFINDIFFLVKFGICFTLMFKDDIIKLEEEVDVLNYFKKYENYSLCFDNEELNKKFDINKILEKTKKIKIDKDVFINNYEKDNPGFIQKIRKINNIKYEFYKDAVRKNTITTILFIDEDSKINNTDNNNNNTNNDFKNDNSDEIKINFSLSSKDKNINNDNKIDINIKEKNDNETNKEINSFNSNNNIINRNNTENSENNKIEIKSKENKIKESNESNEKKSKNQLNESIDDQFNNQMVEEKSNSGKKHDNIIKKNMNAYKFKNLFNRNEVGLNEKNNIFKTFEKKEFNYFPINQEKNETHGLNLPNQDDTSTFIGKNKFKIANQKIHLINTTERRTMNINIDREKINQFCF